MTGPWFLIGAAIGFAAVTVAGYLRRRIIAQRQLNDIEDAIPEWVNRGTGVWPPIVVDLEAFINAIDQLAHEQKLEDSAPWN